MSQAKYEYTAQIIVAIAFVFVIGCYYGVIQFAPVDWSGVKFYEENRHNSCHVIVTQPSIVVRIDDVQDKSVPVEPMIDEALFRGIPVTLGVIPERIGRETKFDNYLRSIAHGNELVEIAQHGDNHTQSDINITEKELEKGFKKIVQEVGAVPVTYIPPYNTISNTSYNTAGKYFKIISGTGGVFKSGEVAEIGQDVESFDYEGIYSTKKRPSNINNIVADCQKAIKLKNLCVVTFHPQELSNDINNATDVNASNMMHYQFTLEALQKINATFIKMSETTRCTQ